MVESTSRFRNQDIVAVKINGEELLKSYYMDEHGQHYLGYYNAAMAMLRELPENSLKLP